MKRTFISLILLVLLSNLLAQVDNEFWFVAPEVTDEHADEPMLFRLTGLDQPAKVTISQPANTGFTPINVSVPANTLVTVNMTSYKSVTENLPINTVNKKGFLITSDVPITAYYEISNKYNPDKFTLKGQNALGTEFFVVGQNDYPNHTRDSYDKAYERVDIVATEDSTVITINPTVDCVDHKAGTSFNITLNRGETYSIQALSRQKLCTLAGTHITSNKDISVTISDDSIDMVLGATAPISWDLIGDQLIPVSVCGTEYIGVRTYYNEHDAGGGVNNTQKLYIVATEDNTLMYLDGDLSHQVVLDEGELFEINISDMAILINSNKPVYVYQLTTIDGEFGSAILPPIQCNGSRSVSFTRNFTEGFWVQLATKADNINNFILTDYSGTSTSLTNTIQWDTVPGTDKGASSDIWYASTVDLSSVLSTGNQYTISNSSGLFQMGIVDQNASSISFGYYSSYHSLKINGLTQQCYGNSVQLDAATTLENASFEWYSSTTGSNLLSSSQAIRATETATYWVEVTRPEDGCVLIDSIDVTFNGPVFDLGPTDIALCINDEITLNPPTGYSSYLWENDSTYLSRTITTVDSMNQLVWLEITDDMGCSNRDSILIMNLPKPQINLSESENIWLGDTLFETGNAAYYQWQVEDSLFNPVDTLPYYVPTDTGTFNLIFTATTNQGCSTTKIVSTTIVKDSIAPIPPILTDVTAECSVTIEVPVAIDNRSGSLAGTTSDTLFYNQEGNYKVTWIFTDVDGNSSTAEQNVIVNDEILPEISCIENQIRVIESKDKVYIADSTEFDLISFSDNCEIDSVFNDFNSASSLDGAELPIGSTTITWTVKDKAGNINQCSFDVTIEKALSNLANTFNQIQVSSHNGSIIITGFGIQNVTVTDIYGRFIKSVSDAGNRTEIELGTNTKGVILVKVMTISGGITYKILQ